MAQRKRPTTQSAISLTHPNAVGIDIDIRSASHFVAVPTDRDDQPVREFPSFTHAVAVFLRTQTREQLDALALTQDIPLHTLA